MGIITHLITNHNYTDETRQRLLLRIKSLNFKATINPLTKNLLCK